MDLSRFDYDLPEQLIAQQPSERRGDSRLLVVDCGESGFSDLTFKEWINFLDPKDLLVFNDSRVMPARLFGRKSTGGFIELMTERLLSKDSALVQTRSSKPVRVGTMVCVDEVELEVSSVRDEFRIVRRLDGGSFRDLLESSGHVPLPPYIKRSDNSLDRERYQTVFARETGSVAAPTASLHLDRDYLARLREKGIESAFITLHIGAGTFQPLRSVNIESQRLHAEWMRISRGTIDAIRSARSRGGRVVAVGTTVARSLEAWSAAGEPDALECDTDLLILPGYEFKTVDALLTNFHLPRSSLLMLVCAFGGTDTILAAYTHAVNLKYRFYSYGDAMFIAHRGLK